jgi:hypothetical protein
MQMHTDDDLYRVDEVFLGPARQTLPFRIRYRAYGIGAVVFALVIVAEIATGLIGVWAAIYGLIGSAYVTKRLMAYIDHERTIRNAVIILAHEVSAPRAPRPSPPILFRPSLHEVRRSSIR